MNPNQTAQNLKRKFSLIAQPNSVPYTNENGNFDETWIEKFGGSKVKNLPDGTNIDNVTDEGQYYIKYPTSSLTLPPNIISEQVVNYEPYSTVVILKVTKLNSDSQYFEGNQIAIFFALGSGSGSAKPYSIAMRSLGRSSDWIEISRFRQTIETGIYSTYPYVPTNIYGGATYFLETKDLSTMHALQNLTLNNIEDSALPINIIFKTDATFSGITATQIKAWIGNTTLNPDSYYKITIVNLIGTIEELAIPQQI